MHEIRLTEGAKNRAGRYEKENYAGIPTQHSGILWQRQGNRLRNMKTAGPITEFTYGVRMKTTAFPAHRTLLAVSLGLACTMPALAQSTTGTDAPPATSAIQASPTPAPSEPAAPAVATDVAPAATTTPTESTPSYSTMQVAPNGAASETTATTGSASTGSATPLPSETLASTTQTTQAPEKERNYGWLGLLGLAGLLGLRRKPVVHAEHHDSVSKTHTH